MDNSPIAAQLQGTPYTNPFHPLCTALALEKSGQDAFGQLFDELTKVEKKHHTAVIFLLNEHLNGETDIGSAYACGFLAAQHYEKDARLADIDAHHAAVLAGDIPRTS